MKTLGQIGYEVYNEKQGGKTYNGQPIPTWDENKREDIKAAWDEAGGAIADEVIQRFADVMRTLLRSDAGNTPEQAIHATINAIELEFKTPRSRRPPVKAPPR
jgi:hypothetical protein